MSPQDAFWFALVFLVNTIASGASAYFARQNGLLVKENTVISEAARAEAHTAATHTDGILSRLVVLERENTALRTELKTATSMLIARGADPATAPHV